MKVIALKTILTEGGSTFSYADTLIAKLRMHPHGIAPLDMKKYALPIIRKIEAATDRVAVEDAEHEFIVKRLSRPDWITVDAAVVQFVDDIKNAPVLDANALLKGIPRKNAPADDSEEGEGIGRE